MTKKFFHDPDVDTRTAFHVILSYRQNILKLKFVWNKYPNRRTGLIVSVELHPFLKSFIDNHKSVLTAVGLQKSETELDFLYIYWIPKIHQN